MAHLKRVKALLDSWGARPALAAAGLCHAFYGTDGFPTALLDLEHRADLDTPPSLAGRWRSGSQVRYLREL
jgi:hypothetical protein